MGAITDSANLVLRNFTAISPEFPAPGGDPSSPPYVPTKAEIRALFVGSDEALADAVESVQVDTAAAAASAASAAASEGAAFSYAEIAEEAAAQAPIDAAAAANAVLADKVNRSGDTMTGPLGFTALATPASPSAGVFLLYFKPNGRAYYLNALGEEREIGTGGGPTIVDYGAAVDGVTDDSTAIADMAADLGFVVFPYGGTAIGTNLTINVPMHFRPGAYITVNAGITLRVQNSVESPRQWIFRGDGTYSFEHTGGSLGAQSRHAHVSWWDVFPGLSAGDIGPKLQKMIDSMGDTREAEIIFDVGAYWQRTAITWKRAMNVRGMGDRLTNIITAGDLDTAGDVWLTGNQGCHFRHLQFTPTTLAPRTSGRYIAMLHSACITEHVAFNFPYIGVDAASTSGEVRHITAHNPCSDLAGSALVRIRGSYNQVEDIRSTVATGGPEAMVLLDATTANAVKNQIKNVSYNNVTGRGVYVKIGGSFNINGTKIKDIRAVGGGAGAVVIEHASTSNTAVISISEILAEAGAYGVLVDMTSSGGFESLTMDDVTARLVTAMGICVTNSSTGVATALTIGTHNIRTLGAGTTGIKVGGTGSAHVGVTIGTGVCNGCPTGYDLKATVISGAGLAARNGGTGFVIQNGTTSWAIQGVANGNSVANKTDNSGAVSKQDNILAA